MNHLFAKTLLTTTIFIAGTALSTPAQADHAWGPYHWARTSNPFTLKLGDNVSGPWDSALSIASADWTKSTVLNTTIVAGGTRPKNCRPTAGRVEVCNAKYGNNGWVGLAQISITGGEHITQGVVKLNDTYFNTSTYNNSRWRNLVTCQEIGHTLGLDHQDENFDNAPLGTCMDYSSNPGSADEHPNQHDYQQLEIIYGHLDGSTTVGQSLPFAPSAMYLDFDRPSRWGRLVSESANGRSAEYELDFGHGNRIVTHVFWADGHRHEQHRGE